MKARLPATDRGNEHVHLLQTDSHSFPGGEVMIIVPTIRQRSGKKTGRAVFISLPSKMTSENDSNNNTSRTLRAKWGKVER